MTTPTVARAAVTQTHADTEKMIYHLCWKFQRRHGGEFSEYLSIANEAFVDSYVGHDADRASFVTWLYTCVWYALLNSVQKEQNRRRTLTYDSRVTDAACERKTGFDLAAALRELSEDAATVTKLCLDTPAELVELTTCKTPGSAREVLRGYLRELGWTASRVRESFAEVRGILA